MTVAEAKIKCLELEGCKGFTFDGKMTDEPKEIFFKDHWDCQGENWTSFKIEERADEEPPKPSFTQHEGYIGGDDMHIETMTVAEAKIKCLELKGCKGFTFDGQMPDEPVEIFFKDHWD